jgi:hypothetical protein
MLESHGCLVPVHALTCNFEIQHVECVCMNPSCPPCRSSRGDSGGYERPALPPPRTSPLEWSSDAHEAARKATARPHCPPPLLSPLTTHFGGSSSSMAAVVDSSRPRPGPPLGWLDPHPWGPGLLLEASAGRRLFGCGGGGGGTQLVAWLAVERGSTACAASTATLAANVWGGLAVVARARVHGGSGCLWPPVLGSAHGVVGFTP